VRAASEDKRSPERLLKGLDRLLLQHQADILHVDTDAGEPAQHLLRLLDIGVDGPRQRPVISKAAMVDSGKVVTVPGPISSSTYNVSR
jgi:hypothetical protein